MFYFKNENSVTVYFADNSIATFSKDDEEYQNVLDKLKKNNWIAIKALKNVGKTILDESSNVTVNNDNTISIKSGKEKVKLSASNKISKFIAVLKEKGVVAKDIKHIRPFLRNMFNNPYIDAVEEIYYFCKNGDFEITKDGYLIAYKKVDRNFKSIYDHKTDHSIGSIVTTDDFCTDRKQTCSTGLHFCSKSYLNQYATYIDSHVVLVKINPADIVSIPTDYNYSKGRCCRYEVIGELAPKADLDTTDVAALTDNKVEVVKTTKKKKEQKKKATAIALSRIEETAMYMAKYGNVDKVSNIMKISSETVKRNMRKYNAKKKEEKK